MAIINFHEDCEHCLIETGRKEKPKDLEEYAESQATPIAILLLSHHLDFHTDWQKPYRNDSK